MNQDLIEVPVSSLIPHPANPRLTLRDDVIDGIAASLKAEGFSPMHAPIVRAVNGHFEIVSGHHRVEAARRAQLESVPAWVAEMSDEEALMRLVLDNLQGELSPLEIGIHAFKAVPLGIKGRGNVGGIRGYARSIHKDESYVRQLVDAAEVYENAELTPHFLKKAQHLTEIHAAPLSTWKILTEALLAQNWNVEDTKHWVSRVNEFSVSDKWQEIFLPLPEVVERFIQTREFSPQTVNKLSKIADEIEAVVGDDEKNLSAFHNMLRSEKGKASWDIRELLKFKRELLAAVGEEDAADDLGMWHFGDWREYVDELEDGSVSLVLTDPPYGIDFQSDYKLDRRQKRNHSPVENDSKADAFLEIAESFKALIPKLTDDAHVLCFCHWSKEPEVRFLLESVGLKVRGSLVWLKNNTGMGDPNTTFAPKHERILHAVKGSPVLFNREPDVLEADRVSSKNHPTEKPIELLTRLINATTVSGELVADPFGGVASTALAAKKAGRVFWSCEVEKKFHQIGTKRLSDA